MTVPIPGTLVIAYLSDGVTKMGLGKILGATTAYFFRMPDGSLHLWSDSPINVSFDKPAKRPPEEWVKYLDSIGVQLVEAPDTAVILLDDDRVVYGCNVFFVPVQEGNQI